MKFKNPNSMIPSTGPKDTALNQAILNHCVPYLKYAESGYDWAFQLNEFGERVLVDGFLFANLDKNTQMKCLARFMSQDFAAGAEDSVSTLSLSPFIYALGLVEYFEEFLSRKTADLTETQVVEYLEKLRWLKEREFQIFNQIDFLDLSASVENRLGADGRFQYTQEFSFSSGKQVFLSVLAEIDENTSRKKISLIVDGVEDLKVVKSAHLSRPSFLIVGTDVEFSNIVIDESILRNGVNIVRNDSFKFADNLYGYFQCLSRLVPELGQSGAFKPSFESSVLFSNGQKALGGHEEFRVRASFFDGDGDELHVADFQSKVDNKFIGSSGGANEVRLRDDHYSDYANVFNLAEVKLEWSWLTSDDKPGPNFTILNFRF